MTQKALRQKALSLLQKPGVYRMVNAKGELLYVGKSKTLNKRVASYFTKGAYSKKIQTMIRQIADFEVYYTDTELDALLLECKWIQRDKPPYNTQLTKVGRYRYFQIEGTKKKQLKLRQAPKGDAVLTIGPFPNRRLAEKTYYMLQQYYPEFFAQRQLAEEKGLSHTLRREYEDALTSFCEECLRHPQERMRKMEEQMQAYVETWAYEEAGKVLKAIQGFKYLQYVYTLTTLKGNWIGWLPIEGSYDCKYYYVCDGLVTHTLKAPRSAYDQVVAQLKAQHAQTEKKVCLPTPDTIDRIRLTAAYKQKMRHVIEV